VSAFEGQSALNDPATSAAVRAGRRRALAWLLGGLAILTLAVVLISIASDRQDALVREGTRVEGVVVAVRHPLRGPKSVTYRYVFEGQEFSGHIGASEFYEVGDVVTVFVDPDQPDRSTLPDEQPQSGVAYWVTIFAIVLGFAGLGSGAWSLLQWRWRRRVLRASPWEVRAVVAEPRSRGRVRLSDAQGSDVFDLTNQQATRLPLLGGVSWPVRIARRGRRVVISSPEGAELALGRLRR
jgi:hypothetical protein